MTGRDSSNGILSVTSGKEEASKMNLVVWISSIALIIIAISSVNSAPSPQFPFTVLPPKGQGHRRPYRPPRGEPFRSESVLVT